MGDDAVKASPLQYIFRCQSILTGKLSGSPHAHPGAGKFQNRILKARNVSAKEPVQLSALASSRHLRVA